MATFLFKASNGCREVGCARATFFRHSDFLQSVLYYWYRKSQRIW